MENQQEIKNSETKVPEHFICPLSKKVMQNPVFIISSGITYEEEAINDWFNSGNMTDYSTGTILTDKSYSTNISLKEAIRQSNSNSSSQTPDSQTLNNGYHQLLSYHEKKLQSIKKEQGFSSNCFNCNESTNYYFQCFDCSSKSCLKCSTLFIPNTTPSTNSSESLTNLKSNLNEVYIILSGSKDKSIKLWNIKSGKCIKTITHTDTDVIYKIIKINNRTIVSCSNKTISFWEFKSGNHIKTITAHDNIIYTIIPLHENLIASGSEDKTIKIWNTVSYEFQTQLEGHIGPIYSLVFIDNRILVSGSQDKTIKFWNIESKIDPCINTLEGEVGHSDPVHSLLKIDDKRLASGSADTTIKIWNIENIKSVVCIKTLIGHIDCVLSLVVLDKDTICSGSLKELAKFWDLNSGECKFTITGNFCHGSSIIKVNENTIACGDLNTIKLFNTETGECLKSLGNDDKAHTDSITSLLI